jgi:hypothetical protein
MNKSMKNKVMKGLIAVINPVSDFKYFYKTAVLPLVNNLKKLSGLLSSKSNTENVHMSWAQAVADTGMSVKELETKFRTKRIIWWAGMFLSALCAFPLTGMILLASFKGGLPLVVLIRAVSATAVLSAVCVACFVQVMSATYRLWQLTQKRVSSKEKGEFKYFWKESGGYIVVLKPFFKTGNAS